MFADVRPDQEVLATLDRLFDRFGTPNGLVLRPRGHHRRRVESELFARGWRRHPAGMLAHDYAHMDDARFRELSFYQRIPEPAARRWSVADLQKDRPLHMDMLRESGSRADAHIVRYALAASHVRPGDTVVDCACGLGYGTAVLASLSRGARFTGVDIDPASVEYAQANYGNEAVRFTTGNAAVLEDIPDASVDFVVSMETIEHVPDWMAVLGQFRRILKPDGRVIASVPDRWVDETGRDPNPFHFHAFDWQKFASGLTEHFILEKRYVQTAPGGFKLVHARRRMEEVRCDSDFDGEWMLALASMNPLESGAERRAEFVHPAFGRALEASGASVVDFARGYDNPYLYRPLVQMGERLADEDRLTKLAELTMITARPGSADQGAAICVIGYRALEVRSIEAAEEIVKRIEEYLQASHDQQDNPHVARWQLSLVFLAGRLTELTGDRDSAVRWFRTASCCDWGSFSPLIATKTIAAAVHEGALHLARGDDDTARDCFARGLRRSLEAIRGDLNEIVGSEDQPIPFGLQELAEIADMGSQCANAIAWLPFLARDRGLFWRQVDIKRFGLAGWARDLERANQQLLARLEEARRGH